MDTLINLKRSGGTLGALSDQERIMLQNAATKIGSWEKKNKNGIGQGVWNVSQKEFKNELRNIKVLTEAALRRAGSDIGGNTNQTSELTDDEAYAEFLKEIN